MSIPSLSSTAPKTPWLSRGSCKYVGPFRGLVTLYRRPQIWWKLGGDMVSPVKSQGPEDCGSQLAETVKWSSEELFSSKAMVTNPNSPRLKRLVLGAWNISKARPMRELESSWAMELHGTWRTTCSRTSRTRGLCGPPARLPEGCQHEYYQSLRESSMWWSPKSIGLPQTLTPFGKPDYHHMPRHNQSKPCRGPCPKKNA